MLHVDPPQINVVTTFLNRFQGQSKDSPNHETLGYANAYTPSIKDLDIVFDKVWVKY
jgi:hypothetical protein